ncbi:MAG: methylase involved in ubiquinone/menaquinone biosynthesis [halophilic archaeon J07HX5]|jgi:Methylase involved in ubiquinone/menaquinone biosynthesis|nr:MAG: methylase involved in ubiquinone/menaquinone biosynthesis [halophilic archaeon J07HX5]
MSKTVSTALADVSVEGTVCLDAGAGAGNSAAVLEDRGAGSVLTVTNNASQAASVRERFSTDSVVTTLHADLRAVPLPEDTVELVTAHALFNVVATPETAAIVRELTRVTAPGGRLVVDDYSPLPDGPVRDLFGAANAVGELNTARPTYTFYPREHLRWLFEHAGWTHIRTTNLLDPVPWPADMLDTHAELIANQAATFPDELANGLRDRTSMTREQGGDGVETGEMYSLLFRLPHELE